MTADDVQSKLESRSDVQSKLESRSDVQSKLDRALGKMDAIILQQLNHSEKLDAQAERLTRVEEGLKATKDVVEAWTAAKGSLRFLKWIAGLVAAIAAAGAAMKGWLQK